MDWNLLVRFARAYVAYDEALVEADKWAGLSEGAPLPSDHYVEVDAALDVVIGLLPAVKMVLERGVACGPVTELEDAAIELGIDLTTLSVTRR